VFFVLHGVNAAERPFLRKRLRCRQVIEFFAKLPSDARRDGGLWRGASLGRELGAWDMR